MSGLSLGSTAKHFLTTSLIGSLIVFSSEAAPAAAPPTGCLPFGVFFAPGPSSGNLQSPDKTQILKDPPVSSLRISNGDLPTKQAYSVHPKDQISTFVS